MVRNKSSKQRLSNGYISNVVLLDYVLFLMRKEEEVRI